MESPTTRRKPCFIEEDDDGLVSLAVTEIGFSGNNNNQMNHNNNKNSNQYPLISRPLYYTVSPRRRNSLRDLSSFSSSSSSSSSSLLLSPRSVFGAAKFYDGRFDEPQQHFLESCSLCKKRLANCDIFMYRGNIPFCSEECRQQQIDMDEAKEKKWNISSIKAMRKKEQQRNSTSPNRTTEDYPFRPGTVAAA